MYLILIIVSGIICLLALITTIIIGVRPEDKTYTKTTKKRMILLSLIYVVTFVPALIFTIVYFYIM
ncbi:hypothetical protein QA612_06925 [Evansella sp. AB-P1]|uniref:hypothetical protein n=1 Tax=Evansella sp. AB-P1 TaxID=3037653 RepID=UPI00241C9832|nr:hypothetical protein [Evansella sp. AB-P1]MDG5787221.1 hypothetical protein [Evansella sp. AB-P1]